MSSAPVERFNFKFPHPVAARLREMSRQRGGSITNTVQVALGLLDVVQRAGAEGKYVGITSDREKLDTVMVTIG